MFSFLRRPKPATHPTEPTRTSTQVITFDPCRIVRGVTFHLLDEGKAHFVESSESVVSDLSLRIDRLTISADKWAEMENSQRLERLLDQSHICRQVSITGARDAFGPVMRAMP
jgi:hypothetical protein